MKAARQQLKPSTWLKTRTRFSTVGEVLTGIFAQIERTHLGDYDPPAVEVSKPRDYTPAIGATPAQALDLPLTPEDPLTDLPF